MWQNISCNTLKWATYISLNHFMGEFSYFRWYLLPGEGGWHWLGWENTSTNLKIHPSLLFEVWLWRKPSCLWMQKVTRGHITAHSEGFFKIFIFWPFLTPFLVKIDPKLTFSLNLGAFFSGRVQNGFETQNGFTRSTFRGMPSFVPKFAFLVVENGLRNPPIWDFF